MSRYISETQADVFWEKDDEVFNTGKENTNEENITDIEGIVRTVITKKRLLVDKAGNKLSWGSQEI